MTENLDPRWFGIGFDFFQWLVVGGIGIYTWVNTRRQVRADKVDAITAKLDDAIKQGRTESSRMKVQIEALLDDHQQIPRLLERAAAVEEKARNLPSTEDISYAHKRMDGLAEGVAELRGALRRIETSLDRMSSYLLTQGRST